MMCATPIGDGSKIAMGIADEDVVEDHTLSAALMKEIRDRMTSDPDTHRE